ADPYGLGGSMPSGTSTSQSAGSGLTAPNDIDHPDATLPSYVQHPPGDCCGPLDGKRIASEVYLRAGPSFNIGGRNLGGGLSTGFDSGAGFRVSFFNQTDDAAWVIDLGVSDIYNSTKAPPSYTLINVVNRPTGTVIPLINVTPEGLNRTYFDYGVG